MEMYFIDILWNLYQKVELLIFDFDKCVTLIHFRIFICHRWELSWRILSNILVLMASFTPGINMWFIFRYEYFYIPMHLSVFVKWTR